MLEPFSTAILFLALALLLGIGALSSRASERAGIPLTLVFLLIGVAAGSEGIGRIPFDDYHFAFRLGSAALVLILFDGGLNTPATVMRRAALPASVLATAGVLGTALMFATGARMIGMSWPAALLVGAVVSSTDAAAVFSVLRGSGMQLKARVGGTLEVESGLNDPMAVILTMLLTQNLLHPGALTRWSVTLEIVRELALGVACGFGVAYAGRQVLERVRLPAGGLYPVLTLSFALFAFGASTALGGSGFLAVYLAGVILGNGRLPFRTSVLRVHDTLAWLGQIAMFLMLGLLVFPSRLWSVAASGFVLAAFLAIVARPLVVALCLAPFRYAKREIAYVGWVGLRGAVPIVLAIYPVLARAPGAERLFDLVFFIVVVNAVVPGASVRWVTRRLGLESEEPQPAPAVLEIESRQALEGELLSYHVDEALDVTGVPLADLPFPDTAAVTMIVRGNRLIAPKGTTTLEPGDHVYVLASAEDRPFVQLMFGRPEES
jgi:cell volume regulation protein A